MLEVNPRALNIPRKHSTNWAIASTSWLFFFFFLSRSHCAAIAWNSLCRPGYLQTDRDLLVPDSQVLGWRAHATTSGLTIFLEVRDQELSPKPLSFLPWHVLLVMSTEAGDRSIQGLSTACWDVPQQAASLAPAALCHGLSGCLFINQPICAAGNAWQFQFPTPKIIVQQLRTVTRTSHSGLRLLTCNGGPYLWMSNVSLDAA